MDSQECRHCLAPTHQMGVDTHYSGYLVAQTHYSGYLIAQTHYSACMKVPEAEGAEYMKPSYTHQSLIVLVIDKVSRQACHNWDLPQ